MISMKTTTDYWFTIEPYVFVNLTNTCALLYNTLDGVTFQSDKVEVIKLLRETIQKENCGVVLLTGERYEQKNINGFIRELREKYMGDLIDVSLSKGKPVQLLPFFNLYYENGLYMKHNFSPLKNVLDNLSEISIHIDNSTQIEKLIPILQSIPEKLTINIIGAIEDVTNGQELLSFLDQHPAYKNIVCSYANVTPLQPCFENNFLYRILVHFPIDMQQWNKSREMLLNQTLPFIYVFDVVSLEESQQAELLVEQFQLEKYLLYPIYTGDNFDFFEENIFLTEEDILSTSMSIKSFFVNQSMNSYDFGKINIMSNGDAFANVNHPALGNIYTHSIQEIVHKEVDEGTSWFRIRNQEPCNTCIYQWLCPSPSNYEILIGRPNLCLIKQ